MSSSNPELLTEAAGVKIFMTPLPEEDQDLSVDSFNAGIISVTLKSVKGAKTSGGKSYGFHLTKSKWDPYPWISYVESRSLADIAGLRAGDCLISIDQKDLIGLKVKGIATLVHHQERERCIKLSVWRYPDEKEESKDDEGLALKGPLPDVARKLVNAVSGTVRILECPICLESSMPPVSQCVHGHIICVGCRSRTSRCPVCRVRLGQGRCLLADKLHKILHDTFEIKDHSDENMKSESSSLRDRLFGKVKKKGTTPVVAKTNGAITKARQLLLTKLLLGGLEKAASADNLTAVSEINGASSVVNEMSESNINFGDRLSLHDRIKSASTGELSIETKREMNNKPLKIEATDSRVSSTVSLASSSTMHTPTWGGSVDSVSCMQITCPLSRQTDCKGIVTPGTLLEHFNRIHEVPQVHFYSANVKIPLPLPFGSQAIYILHYSGDLFFFQYEQETVWISCATSGANFWEWTLHGEGENGTEIKLRRSVATLEDPCILSSQHIAPLPNTLSLHALNIQLLESRSHERLNL